jgi:hypothetical protein
LNFSAIKADIFSNSEYELNPEHPADLATLSLQPQEPFSFDQNMPFGSLDPFSFMDSDAETLDYGYSLFDQQNWDQDTMFPGGFEPETGL